MHSYCPLKVMHQRLAPKKNKFIYPTFNLCIDIHQLESLNTALLAYNKKRPYSLQDNNYGYQDHRTIKEWITDIVSMHQLPSDHIYLLTMPKTLGYSFNPVSFWFFFKDNELRAIIADVNNTFGENHQYLIQPSSPIQSDQYYRAEKVFHVSPFFPVKGHYKFRFSIPSSIFNGKGAIGVWIDYYEEKELILKTSITGRLEPLTSAVMLKSLFKYPFLNMLVMARIHYQALKLWVKGTQFFHKPEPPSKRLTK